MRSADGNHALRLGLALWAGSLLTAGAALADPDTLEVANSGLGTPVVAGVVAGDLVPMFGDLHTAYTLGRQLKHAWRSLGTWQVENVAPADTALSYDITIDSQGREVVAYLRNGGRVVVADRVSSSWVVDTVVTWPGATSGSPTYSVAMDPGTGEAALALAALRHGRNRLYLARRGEPEWTVTEVDSTLSDLFAPSLAFDPQGRAHIVAIGTAPGVSHGVVTAWDELTPGGAFVSAAVDTEGFTSAVIAWDPLRAQPRVAYVGETVFPGPSWNRNTRYAWRGTGGAWSHQDVSPIDLGANLFFRTSLALDPFGNPAVTWLHAEYLAPNRAGPEVLCGSVDFYRLEVSRQRTGEASGPFNHTGVPYEYGQDHTSSTRAVTALGDGRFAVCWRSPRIVSCPPYAVLCQEFSSEATAVDGPSRSGDAALALGPNPLRGGEAFQASWSQPERAEVRLTLHDLAGRTVARHEAGTRDAGDHALGWSPGALRPGCYWLSLRLGGVVRATRMIVVR